MKTYGDCGGVLDWAGARRVADGWRRLGWHLKGPLREDQK
jgi:hypothetical protein